MKMDDVQLNELDGDACCKIAAAAGPHWAQSDTRFVGLGLQAERARVVSILRRHADRVFVDDAHNGRGFDELLKFKADLLINISNEILASRWIAADLPANP